MSVAKGHHISDRIKSIIKTLPKSYFVYSVFKLCDQDNCVPVFKAFLDPYELNKDRTHN